MKAENCSYFFNRSILTNSLFRCFIGYLLLCFQLGNGVAYSSTLASPKRIIVFPLFAEEILVDMVGANRIIYVGHQQLEDRSYSPVIQFVSQIPGSNW